MPPKTKRTNRKRKGVVRKARIARPVRSGNVPEWASMSETLDLGPGAIGTFYNNNDTQLAMFKRASSVAQGYQYFRIKRLTYLYKPLLDTFTSTGNSQVPYLYWVINKSGTEYPNLNVAWFEANGAKPIRFDDKTVKISYSPAVLFDVIEAGVPAAAQQPNSSKISPWLVTTKDAFLNQQFSASQVSHTGHYLTVQSPGSAATMTFQVTVTAEFEFKKPNAAVPPPTDPTARPVVSVSLPIAG